MKAIILTLFVVASLSLPSLAQESPGHLKFHLVVPSNKTHFLPGRSGPLKIELRNVPFERMGEVLDNCKKADLLPSLKDSRPTLYIYLPSRNVLNEQKQFLEDGARAQFESVFPDTKPIIKFRVISNSVVSLRSLSERIKKYTENFGKQFRDDPAVQSYTNALEIANDEALKETERDSQPEMDAPMARRIKLGFAGARFLALFLARSGQVADQLLGDSVSAAGFALIISDPLIEFFNVRFARNIQNLFTKGPIPRINKLTSKRLAEYTNATVWNLLTYGVARPLLMQAFASAANSEIATPTWQDAFSLGEWNLLGAGFFTGFISGTEQLRQKGWLSGWQIDLILQLSGIFDVATGLFSSNPDWHIYRIFTWGPQWSFFALMAFLGKMAPVRLDKFVAVESSIKNWEDVHDEQVVDASWHVMTPEDFTEVVDKASKRASVNIVSDIYCSQLLQKYKNLPKKLF